MTVRVKRGDRFSVFPSNLLLRRPQFDRSTVHRWAIKVLPVLEKTFRRHKKAVGRSWRMDETYIKVRGQWKYLYRAVDK